MSRDGWRIVALLSALCACSPRPTRPAPAPSAQPSTPLAPAPSAQAPSADRTGYDEDLVSALGDRSALCSGSQVDLAQLRQCGCQLSWPPTRDAAGNESVRGDSYCGARFYPLSGDVVFELRGGATNVAPGAELDLVAEISNPTDVPLGVVFESPLWLGAPPLLVREIKLFDAADKDVAFEGCQGATNNTGGYLIGIEPHGRASQRFRWYAATSVDAPRDHRCEQAKVWRPLPPGEYRLQVRFPFAVDGRPAASTVAEWKFRVVAGTGD